MFMKDRRLSDWSLPCYRQHLRLGLTFLTFPSPYGLSHFPGRGESKRSPPLKWQLSKSHDRGRGTSKKAFFFLRRKAGEPFRLTLMSAPKNQATRSSENPEVPIAPFGALLCAS